MTILPSPRFTIPGSTAFVIPYPFYIDVNMEIPVRVTHFQEVTKPAHACIIDQYIDFPHLLRSLRNSRRHLGSITHISLDRRAGISLGF